MSYEPPGGSPLPLWSRSSYNTPLVHDGAHIFFFGPGLQEVQYCNNTSAPLLLDLLGKQLAIDSTYVYWSEGTMIGRIAK